MTWFQIFMLLVADIAAAPGARCALEKPTLSWNDPDTWNNRPLRLRALQDGWLGLVAADGRVQFRSPTGEWSEVRRLPVDIALAVASAGIDLLVAGEVFHAKGVTVFLVGTDGSIKETWKVPDDPVLVHSLVAWKDTYWATASGGWWTQPSPDSPLEFLPGGKVMRHADVPKTEIDGHMVAPWNAALHFGPSGERVYCVQSECQHDGPCHYGFCYRKDSLSWREWGHWWYQPVSCGDYLLEQEFVIPDNHLSFPRNRTIVRRISDGTKVATVRTGTDDIVCASPDEFLLNSGKSVASLSLPSGRRRWSVPVPARAGNVAEAARAGTCTIAITDRDAMVSICPGVGDKMVTTITR
jgi:hypothetical protein